MTRIVIISDTHGLHDGLHIPHGDILVHAGDMPRRGELRELRAFNAWVGTLPHRHKWDGKGGVVQFSYHVGEAADKKKGVL